MFRLCLVLCLFAVGLSADADDFAYPKSAPPELGVAHSAVVDGKLEILLVQQRPVQETITVPVKVFQDGQETTRTETRTVTKWVCEMKLARWDAARGKALGADGKPIAAAELAGRLKKGDTILVGLGDSVDSAWLKALKPETVILLTPEPKGMPLPNVGAPPPPAAAPAPVEPKKPSLLSETEQEVLELANAERKKAGLPPLRPSVLLMKAARKHTEEMARRGTLNHELNGQGPAQRVSALGYAWSQVGENIAHGQRTPAEAMNSWMNSSGHRANLLSSGYSEIGIGVAPGADGRLYWTTVFAAPR